MVLWYRSTVQTGGAGFVVEALGRDWLKRLLSRVAGELRDIFGEGERREKFNPNFGEARYAQKLVTA
jgi:hypothetical protein